ALNLCVPPGGEVEVGPAYQVLHRAGYEHLVGVGERTDASADVDRHAANVLAMQFALAGMQSGTDVEAERTDAVPDRAGALDSTSGAVEGGEEAVAQRLHLLTPKAIELTARALVVPGEERPPAAVPSIGGAPRGVDYVGEHDRRQDPVE